MLCGTPTFRVWPVPPPCIPCPETGRKLRALFLRPREKLAETALPVANVHHPRVRAGVGEALRPVQPVHPADAVLRPALQQVRVGQERHEGPSDRSQWDPSMCSMVTASFDSSRQTAVRSARLGKITGTLCPSRRVQAAPIAAIRRRTRPSGCGLQTYSRSAHPPPQYIVPNQPGTLSGPRRRIPFQPSASGTGQTARRQSLAPGVAYTVESARWPVRRLGFRHMSPQHRGDGPAPPGDRGTGPRRTAHAGCPGRGGLAPVGGPGCPRQRLPAQAATHGPELNPVETLFSVPRNRHFANRVSGSGGHVRETVEWVRDAFIGRKGEVTRITTREWAVP